MALSPNVIAALQLMYTGRGVSQSDLNWWATDGANVTYEEAVLLFAQTPGAAAKYPFFQAPQTANKRQYIAEVYANLYSIDINDESLVPPEELAYWENWLGEDPNNYLLFPDALNNASAAAGLTDRLEVLVAKTDVSLSFTDTFSSVGVNVFTEEQYLASAAIISSVDGSFDSIIAAEAEIIKLASGVNVFTIAQAEAEVILPPLYTIADSADNLIAGSTSPVVVDATHVFANESPDSPLSIDEANTLLGVAILEPGVFYDIFDSAADVLANAGEPSIVGANVVGISDDFIDIATAQELLFLTNFNDIYAIEDTSANILANLATAGGADSVILSDPGVPVTVAQAESLQGLGNFFGPYNIEDTSANILAAAASGVVLGADSVTLSNPLVGVTVEGAETLQGLGNFAGPYAIADTLANLTDAPSAILDGASEYSLTNPLPNLGVITEAQEVIVLGAANGGDFNFLVADVQLTPQVDIVEGNSFLSVAVAEGGSIFNTLNTGDRLTGTGDNPTLSLAWQQDTSGISSVLPVLDGIETLTVSLVGNDLTLQSNDFEVPGLGFITGLKNVAASASNGGDLSMINLQTALETLSVTNYFFGDDVSFSIADPALAGTDNLLFLTVDQVTKNAGDVTSISVSDFSGPGGYETLGLTSGVTTSSKGNTNTVDIEGIVAVESIGITGNENLTLATSLISSTVKVDATGSALIPEFDGKPVFTGDLNAFVDTPGGDLTFLSGSGNDIIDIARDAFGDGNVAGHLLDGGAGDDELLINGNATSNFAGHTVNGGDGMDIIIIGDYDVDNGNAIGGDSAGHIVNGGDDDDSITINGDAIASSIDAVSGHVVNGGAGDDTILISGDAIGGDLPGHTVNGGEGNDFIEIFEKIDGTDPLGNDVLSGDEGNDTIIAGVGNDTIFGGDGNDNLFGQDGNDDIFGGDGEDSIEGAAGNDELFGNDGDDTIKGGIGDDTIIGGAGDDRLEGNDGNDSIVGGAGDDSMIGGKGNDLFIVDAGRDIIADLGDDGKAATGDNFQVSPGAEALINVVADWTATALTFNRGVATLEIADPFGLLVDLRPSNAVANTNGYTVIGNVGPDTIFGSRDNDTIFGGDGDDFIDGFTGNDIIEGNDGDDTIDGGAGDDLIDAGDGNDFTAGDFFLAGVGGFAPVLQNGGKDTIEAGLGSDIAVGDWAIAAIGAIDLNPFGGTITGGNDIITTKQGNNGIPIPNFPGVFIDNALVGDLLATVDGLGSGIDFGNDVNNVTVIGGDDEITGADGRDVAVGDVGLFGFETGVSTIDLTKFQLGQVGEDGITVTAGDDIIAGLGGNDILVGDLFVGLANKGDITIDGGGGFKLASKGGTTEFIGGDDEIAGGNGNDFLAGDFVLVDDLVAPFNPLDPNNWVFVNPYDTLQDDADALRDFRLEFRSIGGDDALVGGQGDDIYYGGAGADMIDIGNDVTLGGVGVNGANEIWYMNGAMENAAVNGANVDVITGFNVNNDKFVFAAGENNFLSGNGIVGDDNEFLNLQAGPAQTITGSLVPGFPPLFDGGQELSVNGTVFNLAPTVINAFANNLNNVFEAVALTGIAASTSGGAPVFETGFVVRPPFILPSGDPAITASVVEMQQINVIDGALAGREFLFINNGVADVSSQDDFLADITGLTGTFGLDLTPNFEVREFHA